MTDKTLEETQYIPSTSDECVEKSLVSWTRLAPVLTLLPGGGGGFYHVWDWKPGPPVCTYSDTVTSGVVTNQQLNDYLQNFS